MKVHGVSLVRVVWALMMGAVLAVAGCATEATAPPSTPLPAPRTPVPRGQVAYHVWAPLLSFGTEKTELRGYAVYTYVLFNCNESDARKPEGKRFDSILNAILHDVKDRKQGDVSEWPREETNIFCIPFVVRKPDAAEALAKYDFDLSMQYLGILQKACRGNSRLFQTFEQNPGPFLVSLYEPLQNLRGKAATKMLYLDLSEVRPDAMREVLAHYRQRLGSDSFDNLERLRLSLRLTLLNYILKVDESLSIVDVAFASFE